MDVYTTATTGQSPFVVTVTITKTATATQGTPRIQTATVAGNVAVSDPTLHATLSSITAIVGVPYAGVVATFTDDAPDPILGDYAATIGWGDGTFSAGTIALANQSGQGFIVTDAGAHVYTTATTGQSPFVVTVTIAKTATATQGAAPLLETATVAGNVAVSDPTLHATLSSITAIVGVPYAGTVATFTDDAPDPILGDYAATISWGDGTFSAGTIAVANQSGQGFIVTDACAACLYHRDDRPVAFCRHGQHHQNGHCHPGCNCARIGDGGRQRRGLRSHTPRHPQQHHGDRGRALCRSRRHLHRRCP